jgi:hypothetical protein
MPADVTIATVVEGHGEVEAVPCLLRRMAAEIAPDAWVDVPRPFRVGRDSLTKAGGIESVVKQAGLRLGPGGRILVLLDADDDCAATLGPTLLKRIEEAVPDRRTAVVLAVREFEAWFLAAAPSLAGCRGLGDDLAVPADPETPRGCKEWLTRHRVDGHVYRPAADQAALAAVFDMKMARTNSPSFDKLWRDVTRLLSR